MRHYDLWVNNLSSFLTQLSFRLQSRQHLLNIHDLLIHRNRYFFFNLVYITVCRYFVITNIIKYIRKQICVPACVTVTLSQLNWCTDFNENHWDTSILKQGTILTMLQISFIDNRPKYLLYSKFYIKKVYTTLRSKVLWKLIVIFIIVVIFQTR